jgi:hypothetical protein
MGDCADPRHHVRSSRRRRGSRFAPRHDVITRRTVTVRRGLAVNGEALGLDQLGGSRDRRQSRSPVICIATVEPHCGTVPVDDHPIAVVFDWSFDRLSGDDEPGRKRIDFHCRGKIGRRRAGNNELSVVFSLSLQLDVVNR